MSIHFSSKIVGLMLAASTAAVFFAPAAEATSVNYNFTVDVISGPLSGAVSHGSFSYDSSSVVRGGYNQQFGLLTAVNFTFNGTTYNTDTVDTYYLGFDYAGDLTSFTFGNSCHIDSSSSLPPCVVQGGSDQWRVNFPNLINDQFVYSTPGFNDFGYGNVTDALVGSVPEPVPEPDTLGLFGFGLLLLGAASWRRWQFDRFGRV